MIKLVFLGAVFLLGSVRANVKLCKDNCPKGEVYARCGTGLCEATCWTPANTSCACVPGCVCGPGLVRDPITFKCIPIKQCPLRKPGQCPYNEQWTDCDGDKGCQKTCDTLNAQPKCGCTPGCACKKGNVRSPISGYCIPISACENCPVGYAKDPSTNKCNFCCQDCPENEEYSDCGTACERECHVKDPPVCTLKCVQGCFCKPGYIRQKGICIPESLCKRKKNLRVFFREIKSTNEFLPACPKNESFSCGNPSCEKDCSNYKDICTIVNVRCEDKCYCNKGFVRLYKNGPCVPIQACSWLELVASAIKT